ncbi:hypothetical protein [Pseudomonas sp. W2Jun17]|uniref:hypothetical protein n=1 Tax=Pseudomonas sp. W2Jun17 TaxID=1553460 RepID=UPI002002D486|nr:hypothetical protein [Pseudomonas sp. W2Jun17]MCK3850533.1 hypothetical protein [Pseudomonas sp. W2Jun17]
MNRDEMLQQIQERFELHLQITSFSVKLLPAEPEPETNPRDKESSQLDHASAQDLADIEKEIPQYTQ